MPRVKQFNEQDVLNKAMELFWKKGFHATSMDELVKYLGINRASLYSTFGGKRELFDKALKLYRDQNKHIIADLLDSQPSVKDGLLRLFELAIEKVITDEDSKGCFVVNSTTEFLPGDPEMEAEVCANQQQFEQILGDYLQKGVERGEISSDKDVPKVASMLFMLYNGLQVIGKANQNRDALMETVKIGLQILD